ncbi:MAG: amidohydrolase [Colwelliaceae bacterium]|nr:amidohydrolase [Colwelliaceae bacterium]
MEPVQLWSIYLDTDIYSKFTIHTKVSINNEIDNINMPKTFYVGDIPILNNWNEDIQIASSLRSESTKIERIAAMKPESQLVSMDESEIKCAAIFSTFAGFIVNHSELPADVSLAYADAYNRWLKDYCDYDSDRLKAVGIISRHDPINMIEQLEKVVENGWTSITLRPEVIMGRVLGHADYNDFWAACEKHNIAVAFHGGTNLHAPTAGTDRFTSRFAMHACSHPMEAQMAFVSLLESGVLERHPRLKFAFLEAGASWVPHWLWRLDNICYPEFPTLVEENIKMLPSEYFKRQCWVGIELGEPCLREVIDVIGHDKLLYGSDFPHPDHLHFSTEDIAQQLSELNEIELKAVLEQNAKDFYGFESLDAESACVNESDSLVEAG